ncbi:MAG: ABC transporter substrate-binding protein [Oscillospiraceae bacterium]|nr:ABC transporter substrate-binding protein [Oscillospiraceae bacterium]
MKKAGIYSLILACAIAAMTGCGANEMQEQTAFEAYSEITEQMSAEKTVFNIASLKGPTTMGMVKLMKDSESGLTANRYVVTIHGTADEIVPAIVSGKADAANVPANLSSVLYTKTKGAISAAAVNTLGVLYMVETGDSISSVEDLRGRTIYSTGKGTTPEYVLNYILAQNGIDPQKDVTVEYKSEATEVAAMLAETENAVALLPQPFVTVASSKNDKLRICLDMTEEWNKVSESKLVTGVVIAQNSFIENNKDAFGVFLDEYAASTEYVNSNVSEAAAWIGEYDIVAAGAAEKALPYCNITFIRGNEMRTAIGGYLEVLFGQNPSSVGGALPDEKFYFAG